jgi:hypothetical protein
VQDHRRDKARRRHWEIRSDMTLEEELEIRRRQLDEINRRESGREVSASAAMLITGYASARVHQWSVQVKTVNLPDRFRSTLRRWRLFEAPKLARHDKPWDELSDAEKHERLRERW